MLLPIGNENFQIGRRSKLCNFKAVNKMQHKIQKAHYSNALLIKTKSLTNDDHL